MAHVFVPNIGFSVRCMRPYDEYRLFTPNPEGGARSNATLFDNRQEKNSECRELRTWKQSPLDSDQHVCHMYWQKLAHSTVCEMELWACVSFLSHSAQIQIFHNISIFAM